MAFFGAPGIGLVLAIMCQAMLSGILGPAAVFAGAGEASMSVHGGRRVRRRGAPGQLPVEGRPDDTPGHWQRGDPRDGSAVTCTLRSAATLRQQKLAQQIATFR